MTADVDTESLFYKEMKKHWDLPLALAGGTTAMRAAKTKFLPMEVKEQEKNYEARVQRTFLHNCFMDAVEGLAGQVFSRDIYITGGSETSDAIELDVGKGGGSLSRFSKELFKDAEKLGLSYILVDADTMERPRNYAEQKQSGQRPYFVHVSATQLIGAKVENGETTEIRILEQVVEYDGYEEGLIPQIREIKKTTNGSEWILWRKPEGQTKYAIYDQGARTLNGVGLVPLYLNKTGEHMGRCALEELAWLNLNHWQSSSDQNNILHVARVPRIFAKNLGEAGQQSLIDHGVSQFILGENADADVKWLEHNGNAIDAGVEDLERLELKMAKKSLEPMMRKSGTETATAKAIDSAKANSQLMDWAKALEQCLSEALDIADEMADTPAPNRVVDVNSEFSVSLTANEDFAQLLELNALNKISDETLLKEAKRLNKLGEDIDIDLELEQVRDRVG